MANGAFNFKNNSGNIVSFISGSGSDIIISGGTLNLSNMTGLTLGNLTMEGTVETASFAPSYLLTSSFNTYSGTTNTVIGTLQTSTASLNTRISTIEGVTGSYATTGSNIFKSSQTITGSLFVSENLVIAGSSSIQYISSSIVNIDDNIITVNAMNPSVRFGGLSVIDSGSSPQVSGSMLFDSINNQWLFVHQNQGTVTSSVLLMGPETYNDLGNEGYITANRLVKSTGIEHLTDSNITDTGTKVSINSNTEITGTFVATGTALVSGSAQITYGSISSIPSGIVSGSAQVDVMSTTNIARLATTGSNTFTSNQIVSGSVSVSGSLSIGGSTSTSQLNVFTSSVSTQNVMSEFYNGDFTAGTRNFIRVRNSINAGSTMSSYFGQGQDGKTYIVSNDFTKNNIVIDGNSTFVGINKNTPNAQLDVNGNTIVSGSLTTTGRITIKSGNGDQLLLNNEGERFTQINLSNNSVSKANIWWDNNNTELVLLASSSGTGHLKIASTGNATFSGSVTTTNIILNSVNSVTSTAGSNIINSTYTGINGNWITYQNAGGILYAGLEDSTSSAFGATPYAGVLYLTGARNLEIFTSNTKRLTITSTGTVQPGANGTQDLGTASLRWGTVYTSDLSLSNGIGDYTIVEGEEKLYLYNNKNNKVYSFVLQEEDPLTATPKKS